MDSELQMKEYGDESKSGGDASPILDPSIDSSDDVGDDEPPDGGYGWVCVIVCFMINAHTWGINSVIATVFYKPSNHSQAYGVFLAYYLSSNTFPGATRTQFAFIGGLSVSSALLLSPLATFSARRLGTRATLLLGVLFQTTSFVAASYSRRVWQLFLSQGLCFGLGLGFLFVVSVGIVPQWFKARRSLANGVAAAGSGFGGLAYSLAAGAMIPRLGLPWAFRVLAVVSFVVNFVCAILLRDRNAQVGSSLAAFDVRLFRGAEFWGLLGFGFFSMLGYVVLLFSIPNYASRVGLTAHQGSVVGAVLNLGQGLGRGPIGYFSDAVGRINIAAMLSLLSSVLALVLWTEARTYGVSLGLVIDSQC
jgi:MFS family permease